jgi:hypothetical protein
MKKLEKKELERLQELNNSFTKLKISLGDLELKRHETVEKIKQIKDLFLELETKLIDKYGEESVINLETGLVTEKKQ